MSDPNECGCKPALFSKTVHFNLWSTLAANAAIPFLPQKLQSSPWIVTAVTAWFMIGNLVLRRLTKEAIRFWSKGNDGTQIRQPNDGANGP